MFDFAEYKRRIMNYGRLSNIKVVRNESQHHEVVGYLYLCGYKIMMSITCDCYGSFAYVRPIFIIGQSSDSYYYDNEYFDIQEEIIDGLSKCGRMQYNGIFDVGGVNSEIYSGVGLRYTDLNATDNIKDTSLAFKCIDTAIYWADHANIRIPLGKFCRYFADKKKLFTSKY